MSETLTAPAEAAIDAEFEVKADAAPVRASAATAVTAFSFGDPEPVIGSRGLMDYVACWSNGRWYEPPISLAGLSRVFRVSPHHSSAITVKRNLLSSSFVPCPLLSRQTFEGIALDYLGLGNCYLERRDSLGGRPLRLERSMAKYTRRKLDMVSYTFLGEQSAGILGGMSGVEHDFAPGTICHLLEPDMDQEVYGLPEYLSALQAAFLNESATLFRRRYYLNGSHAGFILYMNGPGQTDADVDAIRQAMRDSKGPGNFRNLFVHAPGATKDGIQVIPVSEVAAKDEFLGIKNTTRDDILAAHRVPPQLLGVVPANAGGFGDVAKAADVFHRNEIEPLQRRFLAINDWLGQEAMRFADYVPLASARPAAA